MEEGLPEKIRTFIGIFPPASLVQELKKVQIVCQKDISPDAISWTGPEQIHVTLNFLGNIQSSQLPEFQNVMAEVVKKVRPFSLSCQKLGSFPPARSPRVFWAGLAGELDPLCKLKAFLDEAFKPLGIIPEERAFHPHLTLGRVKHLNAKERARIEFHIQRSANQMFGEWRVETAEFVRSILSPPGSFYGTLKSFPLGS